MRLLVVLMGILFVLSFIWFSLYLWGMARPIMNYPYDYLPAKRVYVEVENLTELDMIEKKIGELGVYILLQEQAGQVHCGPIDCTQWVPKLRTSLPVLLDIRIRSPSAWEVWMAWAETWRHQNIRVAVQVENRSGLRYLKEQLPRWAFGLDPVEKVKWQVASSVFLQSTLELNYEFWMLDKRLPQELMLLTDWQRRKKDTLCIGYGTFQEWEQDYLDQKCSAYILPMKWWMQYVTNPL